MEALRARRRALAGAWERFRDTGSATGVRAEVAASWDRSTSVLERPVEAAPVDSEDQVRSAWAGSPLRAAVAEIADDVDSTARDFDLVAAVTDASGRILWSAGGRHMRDRAAAVNFVPGGHWDEGSVGTNALDLALRSAQPATVFSAEHYSPAVHGWVCYAAPLVDRRDGRVLGVLDLSTTWDRSNPMALATVTAFARTISHALTSAVRRADPERVDGGTREASAPLALEVLGRPRAWQGGVPVLLPMRQAEILLALAEHPRGLTVDQLAAHVYGDQPVTTSTVKAEVSRLRRVLPGIITSRPYQLLASTSVDAHRVLDSVAAGDARAAAEGLTDSVLPASESPIARALALRVEVAVRSLVLRTADADAAVALARHRSDDLEVVDHALSLLPVDSPQRALLEGDRTAALLD